jgi:DNA polymerase-3 subunit gamma/tau
MGENKQTAHKALYRKYRPKSLDDIIGQDHVTSILRSAVKQNKINHAYLLPVHEEPAKHRLHVF